MLPRWPPSRHRETPANAHRPPPGPSRFATQHGVNGSRPVPPWWGRAPSARLRRGPADTFGSAADRPWYGHSEPVPCVAPLLRREGGVRFSSLPGRLAPTITQTSTTEDRKPRASLGLITFLVKDYIEGRVELAVLLPVPPFSEQGYCVNVLKAPGTGVGIVSNPGSACKHRRG